PWPSRPAGRVRPGRCSRPARPRGRRACARPGHGPRPTSPAPPPPSPPPPRWSLPSPPPGPRSRRPGAAGRPFPGRTRGRGDGARQRGLAGLAAGMQELEERRAAAQAAPDEGEPSREQRDRLAEQGTALRRAEMEARLAARTAEERARALAGRADALERGAR